MGPVTMRLVVMGVAGCGKSTVGAALADRFGARYIEADDLHLTASVAKMSAGMALSDVDRWPWLYRLRKALDDKPVVISCSALKKSYRDLLRRAGDVRFVFLDVNREEAIRRLGARAGHFMGPSMVDSQFAALERPGPDEPDVITLDGATTSVDAIIEYIIAAAEQAVPAVSSPLLVDAGTNHVIDEALLRAHIGRIVDDLVVPTTPRRVLIVPPDHTRLHSRAGDITGLLYTRLIGEGCDVGVLPALGTHHPMSPADAKLLFGDAVPFEAILHHQWRDELERLGEIDANEVAELTAGRYCEPIPVEVDRILLQDWDMVISVGQVVPHEVIGLANFTKNIVIGLGGAPTVHRSHFVGAIADMETIMGRADSPVRHAVDAAFDRYIAPCVKVLWILTVMEDTSTGVLQRGIFVGAGRSSESGGAAYRAAAELAVSCNVDLVDRPFTRVACWLDPNEFRSTWLGNKAVYRTRMAIADGGELIVLAPGVRQFGEDAAIDALIRRHGYRGTEATLHALAADADLASSLGAAAHLIHGSSEGRFTIVYCTDPSTGGLTRAEVEGVGFMWRSLPEEMRRLGLTPTTPSGERLDTGGVPFDFIANPALGLWATADRFTI
jgi:carbohydrate kinase (thermoresistant glucokinase family)